MAVSERNNCSKCFVQVVDLRYRMEPASVCSVEKMSFYRLISAHNALLTISFLANSQTTSPTQTI